jgi:hypothetical protein
MSIEVGADLFVDLTDELKTHSKHLEDVKSHVIYQHPLDPLQVPLVAGSGTLDLPAQMGPVRGCIWSIRRLTLSGWTGGSVIAYIDGIDPIPFAAAGMYTFGRGELMLESGQRLVVVASGVTGYVQLNGVTDVFETKTRSRYLGGF